jgi:DnaK suppressor protein
VNDASLRNAQSKMSHLKDALYKLENGKDFGKCRSCEKPIKEDRLLLMPESRFCVQCARK